MSREKQLVKNTIIITIGKLCTQLITFLLLPLYTSILSTEEYGVVDLLNTLISLAIPVITLQIEQGLFRRLIDNRDNKNEIKRTISTSFYTITLQLGIYILVFVLVSPFIKNNYKYFLVTNVIMATYSSMIQQIVRGLGDNRRYAISSFFSASVSLTLNVIFIAVFRWNAYGMLSASLLGSLSSAGYLVFSKKLYRYIDFKDYSKDIRKKLLKYSIPLIPNAISWWIFNSSDRTIVSSILGVSQNGILSASYKFSNVYITLYNIFNMTWTETASLHIKDRDKNEFFSNVINVVLRLFVTIAFGIIVFMPFIFPIMINVKFSEAYKQIPILMLSSIFNVVVGLISVIYIANKDTKSIAKTSAIAAIINLVVNLSLIRFIGLYAASISTLISYLAMSIYRYIDVKKYVKIRISSKYALYSTFFAITILIMYYINNIYLNIFSVCIYIIYAFQTNKKTIKKVIDLIIKKVKNIRTNK